MITYTQEAFDQASESLREDYDGFNLIADKKGYEMGAYWFKHHEFYTIFIVTDMFYDDLFLVIASDSNMTVVLNPSEGYEGISDIAGNSKSFHRELKMHINNVMEKRS